MAPAHCMLDTEGYKHTLRICNTYCFFTATVATRTRLDVTLHVHCQYCSVVTGVRPRLVLSGVVLQGISIGQTCLFVCLCTWASAASHGCTAAFWLIVPPAVDVQTLATRCPRAYRRVPHSSGGSWNLLAGIGPGILPKCRPSTVHLGFFYMPQICDMGPTAFLPFLRKAC
jgi:hypothetical protein